MCHNPLVQVRGQLVRVVSLILPCWSWASNSDCQTWHQAPLWAEQSHGPKFYLLFDVYSQQSVAEECGPGTQLSCCPQHSAVFRDRIKNRACDSFLHRLNRQAWTKARARPSVAVGFLRESYNEVLYNSNNISLVISKVPS